jgi:hypothetical protein
MLKLLCTIRLSRNLPKDKHTHWMWFIFPQLTGLGHSPTAQHYAIQDLDQAKRYLADPILGRRLRQNVRLVMGHKDKSALEILGSQIVRFLEPIKAIRVHLFKPKTFVIGQSDGDGVFVSGNEFEPAVVIIMDSFVSEGFICTAHGDVVAVLVPADIYFVTRHAIEVRERAFNGLAVDICAVHERYFQFESKKLLAGFFIPC